jgi:hypothetical protein
VVVVGVSGECLNFARYSRENSNSGIYNQRPYFQTPNSKQHVEALNNTLLIEYLTIKA